jgi:hypothetical protein
MHVHTRGTQRGTQQTPLATPQTARGEEAREGEGKW